MSPVRYKPLQKKDLIRWTTFTQLDSAVASLGTVCGRVCVVPQIMPCVVEQSRITRLRLALVLISKWAECPDDETVWLCPWQFYFIGIRLRLCLACLLEDVPNKPLSPYSMRYIMNKPNRFRKPLVETILDLGMVLMLLTICLIIPQLISDML